MIGAGEEVVGMEGGQGEKFYLSSDHNIPRSVSFSIHVFYPLIFTKSCAVSCDVANPVM